MCSRQSVRRKSDACEAVEMIRRWELKRNARCVKRYERKVLNAYLQEKSKKDRTKRYVVLSTSWTRACDTIGDRARRIRKALGVGYFANRRKVGNGKGM